MCLNIKVNNIIFPDGTMCLNIKLNNILFPDGTMIITKSKGKMTTYV